MEVPWGSLGVPWGSLGVPWRPLGIPWGSLGVPWVYLGGPLGPLGNSLGVPRGGGSLGAPEEIIKSSPAETFQQSSLAPNFQSETTYNLVIPRTPLAQQKDTKIQLTRKLMFELAVARVFSLAPQARSKFQWRVSALVSIKELPRQTKKITQNFYDLADGHLCTTMRDLRQHGPASLQSSRRWEWLRFA